MPVYFIRSDQVQGRNIAISGALSHHLRDVLRVRVGETLRLVDEQPRRYLATVVSVTCAGLTLTLLEAEEVKAPQGPVLHLGIGLSKNDRMDWLLQKATELGISRLSPLMTRRSAPLPRERFDHQHRRWTRIVTEAAQQSCRWDIPAVDVPVRFETFISDTSSSDLKLILMEAEGRPGALDARPSMRRITLLVGPAGGWDPPETHAAIEAGYSPFSLGPRTLRSETAALAALAIVRYEVERWPPKVD